MHNIRKVKGFSPAYRKSDAWYDSDAGFDLRGNSNGVLFTAYDKEAAIANEEREKEFEYKRKERLERIENAKNLLRLEVKLISQKAIKNYTKQTSTAKRIEKLSKKSMEIFLDTCTKVVPCGDFYKKDKTVEIIEGSSADKRMKRKMIKLVELIHVKKSLHLAVKEMNDRNIEKVFHVFRENNLSPVTISKRQKVKYLENLYDFIIEYK